MNRLLAVLAAGSQIVFAGCGDGDDAPLDLTGIWDLTDLTGNSGSTVTLVQTGGVLTGAMDGMMPLNGTLTDNLTTFIVTMGPHTVTLSGTVSDDGNSMAGTWVNDSNDAGTFSALRRGTGEGVDMTGTWLSLDLTTSASLTMQVTQNGNVLSGTTLSTPSSTIQGTINGNMVTFVTQAGGTIFTWTGFLSFDGNTVSGEWVSTSATWYHGWRMTRQ